LVIDLGADWEQGEARAGSVWRFRRGTRLLVGLLVCLLLAGLAAGSATPEPAFRLVASVPAKPGDTYSLSGNRLFLVRSTVPVGRSSIDAYRLPDGRHLWQARFPAQVHAFPVAAAVGVMLTEGTRPLQQPQQLTALDAASGRVLWRLPDAELYEQPETTDSRALVLANLSGGPRQLRLVDLRSGAAIWSRPLAAGTRADVLAPRRLVLWAADGTAQILDEDTGRVLVSGRLRTTSYRGPLDDPPGSGAFSAGDRLIVTYPLPHDATGIAAYRMSTLDELWRVEVPGPVLNVANCAAVLCVSGRDGMTTIDPATGQRRWTTPRWLMGGARDGFIQAAGVPSGRYPQGSGTVFLDPETGAVRLDLSAWSPAEPVTPGRPALLTTVRRGPLGVWVGALDRDGTAVRPVGFLPRAVPDACAVDRAGRLYLACADYGGKVDVWVARPALGR
jgi:outer membrane protein assembly factor BamB